jgi:transposase
MFPRIAKKETKSGTYEYLVISESIRIKGKGSTTRNIANLGNVTKFSKNVVENLIDGLIRLFQIEKYGLSNEFEILASYEHGSIILWRKLWNSLELSKMIQKHLRLDTGRIKLEVDKYIEMMVMNRCIEPLSKLGGSRWIERTCYKVMKGYDCLPLQIENFYRSMDYVLTIKDRLEYSIFERLRSLFSINVKLTFYDITSTFFYTDSCGISKNGYSRDEQPDKVQIVIGVVTSWEGYPIKHYVFAGNTKDETTVIKVVKELKESFNIEETTFVGDRGMITKLNLNTIVEEGFDYIMGVKHRQNEIAGMLFKTEDLEDVSQYKACGHLLIQERLIRVKDFLVYKSRTVVQSNHGDYTELLLTRLYTIIENLKNTDILEYTQFKTAMRDVCVDVRLLRSVFLYLKKYEGQYEDSLRMVICLNQERKVITRKKRQDRITTLSKELNDLFSTVNKKQPDQTTVTVESKLDRVFEGYKRKFKKFFIIERDEKTQKALGYSVDKNAITEEEKGDGIFVLVTSRFDLEAAKIIESYKNLKEVEMLFDDLKNFVDIRPVRHWLEKRVRAHVLICILSLLLKRVFEINHMKGKAIMQPLEEISKSKLVYYRIQFSEKEQRFQTVPKITTVTQEQEKYFKLVGITNPMSLENYVW